VYVSDAVALNPAKAISVSMILYFVGCSLAPIVNAPPIRMYFVEAPEKCQ
jgi:hypothetical protein